MKVKADKNKVIVFMGSRDQYVVTVDGTRLENVPV